MHEVIIEFLGKVFQGWQSVLPSRGPPYIRIPWTSDVDTFLGGCESAKKKKKSLSYENKWGQYVLIAKTFSKSIASVSV